MGLTPEAIENLGAGLADGPHEIEVHPANWSTVKVYESCMWELIPVKAGM